MNSVMMSDAFFGVGGLDQPFEHGKHVLRKFEPLRRTWPRL